jgi:hypothetical protein
MHVPRSLARRGEFEALEFLAALSCHVPKTYESITRYYGRYSCGRRGERAKLSPPPAEETESDYRREFRKSSWAACIERIYEVDPLECPKCKAQMRIVPLRARLRGTGRLYPRLALNQGHHEGSRPRPELGRTAYLTSRLRLLFLSSLFLSSLFLSSSIPLRLSMNCPSTTRLSRLLMTSKFRFLGHGTGDV